ncbi:hypothetical protein HSX11_08555 [Oxalobacteraceae bacterium]|nr:hypothetical protein [Oxalobacteraceae bacterium]
MSYSVKRQPMLWPAALAVLLVSGCSSLQVDVDVYKGPLAHEPEIQVRQYASMAISAKPSIEHLYCSQLHSSQPLPSPCTSAELEISCEKTTEFKRKFLCEILDLYEDADKQRGAKSTPPTDKVTQNERPYHSNPAAGLGTLTHNVTAAMAGSRDAAGYKKRVDDAVDELNEALIFFAQKLLYVTNNQLLFGTAPNGDSQPGDPKMSVLQSLGNTILVHANDLQRQHSRTALLKNRSASESDAVQQAFQPEPSVTLDAIVSRLKRYTPPDQAKAGEETLYSIPAEQQAELDKLNTAAGKYLSDLSTLIAAHRTVKGELPAPLIDDGATDVDIQSALDDRKAIAALYPDQKVETGAATPDALKPLNTWLIRELEPGVVTAPHRIERLKGLRKYLTDEAARLTAAGINTTAKRSEALVILQNHIAASTSQAVIRTKELNAPIAALQAKIKLQSERKLAEVAKLAKETKAKSLAETREKSVAVVESARASVLLAAAQINTRDPKVIGNQLLHKLDEMAKADKPVPANLADIKFTRSLVELIVVPGTPCYAGLHSRNCKAESTVDVVDNLIASLRAQRVQAIAKGETVTADNLLKAINVAYDQRTAMIYLRPASDYLRSVYSATQLQDGTEQQYRNMLFDWLKKYLNPFENDAKYAARGELEKMHWQNINKVTVSGGGFTNYVLAKDDVGNWYVKAYSDNPEAIIKSASSLALFNSGKTINTNLLRRFDVQRKLDEDKSLDATQRTALQQELTEQNKQGGASLLKVRDRYASRYQRDTNAQASALLAVVTELPVKAPAQIATVPNWPETSCQAKKAGDLLSPLDAKHLEPGRAKLIKVVADNADPAKASAKLLDETEKSIQAALTGMHLYSSDAQRVLAQAKVAGCEAEYRSAADLVRNFVRAQVASAATERKLSIERYEDALSNIMEIAGEK